LVLSAGHPARAQKRGGILRLASPASPANMSILETATIVDLPTRTPARFAKTNFA